MLASKVVVDNSQDLLNGKIAAEWFGGLDPSVIILSVTIEDS